MFAEMQPAVIVKVTVLFEDPYWVGLVERSDEHGYTAARVIFGSEPTPPELYNYMARYYTQLEFSQPTAAGLPETKKVGFKRMLRESRQVSNERGVGAQAQEALKQSLEARKRQSEAEAKQQREQEAEKKYLLKQAKRKEKQRGR